MPKLSKRAKRTLRAQENHKRLRLLNRARWSLGIGQEPRKTVAALVAEKLGVPLPRGKVACDALLARYVGENPALRPQKKPRPEGDPNAPEFLTSYAWRKLRMVVLKKRGPGCECCGAKAPDVRIHVDHIKPRRKYPELALEESNLQVLCEECNHGKGNWDETDWRPETGERPAPRVVVVNNPYDPKPAKVRKPKRPKIRGIAAIREESRRYAYGEKP